MSSLFLILFLLSHSLCVFVTSAGKVDDSRTLLWPLPAKFTFGNKTLSVDPALSLVVGGSGGGSGILKLGFDRYREIIFENSYGVLALNRLRGKRHSFDINKLRIVVQSSNEDLQLGVDESYTLFVAKKDGKSVAGEATIEANTVYGALRALELPVKCYCGTGALVRQLG